MFRKKAKTPLVIIGIITLVIMQLLVPLTQGTALAAGTVFDNLEMNERVKVRNLAIVFAECYGGDNTVSSEEVSSGRWLDQGWGIEGNRNIGYIVEPNDGVVGCQGDDANWIYQLFVEYAGYASLEEAFAAVAVTKSATDTNPDGELKPENEIKQILNAKFGTDIFALGDKEYLTYRSNYWNFINTCTATPVSGAQAVGLTGEIYIVSSDGVVQKQLYKYDNKTFNNVIGDEQNSGGFSGSNGDIDCTSLVGYLATKSHADAYLVALNAQIAATGQTRAEVEGDDVGSSSASGAGTDCTDIGGFGLTWIICPIGSAMAWATTIIDEIIYNLLYIDTDKWETSGVKEAWGSFRTISSTLIVLIALVGIASQVFNFDFVSAYTIRKILPKLFIAAILIQVSWILAILAIDISNTIGYGVQALVTVPFEGVANQYASVAFEQTRVDGWIGFSDVLAVYAANTPWLAQQAGAAVAAGGLGVGAFFSAVSIAGLVASTGALAAGAGTGALLVTIFAIVLPIFVAVVAAFVIIVLRVVLIVGLLMVAPLAIVAWILPNTSKWATRWWAMFFALLAFFPIVIFFLTIGKVAALIIATSGTMPIISFLGILIAYFVPYFLLFKIIKFSSGALGRVQSSIDGVANSAKNNKGLQGWRKGKMDSANVYAHEEAKRRAATAGSQIDDLKGQKGAKNWGRRQWRKAQFGAATGQLGNKATFGELQQRESDKLLDQAKSEADGTINRHLRDLSPDQIKLYLDTLKQVGEDGGFDKFGKAKIEVGGREFDVSEAMWAASLPRQKNFKSSIDKILEASKRTDKPHLAAMARRTIADNAGDVDNVATDFSRLGAVIDEYHGANAQTAATAAIRAQYNSDPTKRAAIDKTASDKGITVDQVMSQQAADTLRVVRKKQTDAFDSLPTERKRKVATSLSSMAASGDARTQEEAIGLALSLVNQAKADKLSADDMDLLQSAKAAGLDIDAVAKSAGNYTFKVDGANAQGQGGRIIMVSTAPPIPPAQPTTTTGTP